jgi:hypothetical protein
MKCRAIQWMIAMVLLAAAPMLCARADGPTLEEKVKAAFVFNFMQFTEWPEGTFIGSDTPIVVGFVGDEGVADIFRAATASKTVNGRAISVKQVQSESDAGTCQVVVFGGSDGTERLKGMGRIKEQTVLTIGDSDGFSAAGGIIQFYVEDGKERFEVNTLAAERAHLQISSKLLKLAKIVRK